LNQTDREETPIEAVVVGVGRSNYHGPIAKKLKNKLRTFDDDISQPLCRLWFYDGGNGFKMVNPTSDEYEWEEGESFQIQLLAGSTVDSHSPFESRFQTFLHARLVRQNLLVDLVKSWIQYCECHHPQGKDTNNSEAPENKDARIRLIDVENLQLIEGSSSSRYIALTYVWGNSNFLTLNRDNYDDLHMTQGLSKFKLPQTIADAILLCVQLGERCLWVDSLCIQQDDENDKISQIQCMEMIYEKAIMTIANVSGGNTAADHSIPGVRPNTRQPFQEVHHVMGLKVVVSRQYPQQQARAKSMWATRAWTIQEEILSQRVLHISDTHCWLQCPTCNFSEDMNFEPIIDANTLSHKPTPIKQLFKNVFMSLNRLGGKRKQETESPLVTISADHEAPKATTPKSLESLFELIEIYLTRHLTLPSDALNAIDGVLHRAGKLEHGFDTTYHYGLPVIAFDYALCWLENEHDPTKRRVGFPSWSWSGWFHTIKFPLERRRYEVVGTVETAKSLFTNAVLDPESQTFDHDLEDNRSFDELRQTYGINISPKSALTTDHLGPGILKSRKDDPRLLFYTSCAKLRVDSQPVEPKFDDIRTKSCEVYTLRSPGNEQVDLGMIRLNRGWRSGQRKALELDFIVVRATPSAKFESWWHSSQHPDRFSSLTPNQWTIHLMCINWIDENVVSEQPRRAERFTICMVDGKKSNRRDREERQDLYVVERWMSVEPKPIEVLVELV
jgi:hypothetical protein